MNPFAEPAWVMKYVGMPYVDKGRDSAGVDCWGLPWLLYREELAVVLNAYGPVPAANIVAVARVFERDKALPPWVHIASANEGESSEELVSRVTAGRALRPFDLVAMLGRDAIAGQYFESHVGVMIGHRRLIHTESATGTVKVGLSDFDIRWRVTGFYRHEALA